ncbi:MAG: septum site-determining protein MinD [Oscillospiraceae bacterium]|nr:septum site-determining protein MinD [Oscillospiraceae bacterium]
MGKAILVTSGKGGTGKTTLTAGLAACLAAMGRRVVCIDADVGLRNLDLVLGMPDAAALDFHDVLTGGAVLREALYRHPQIPGLYLLSAPSERKAGQIVPELFSEMVKALQKHCDYCMVDCAAGLGESFALAAGACDHAIVVGNLEPAAIRDATRTAELLHNQNLKAVWLALNRVRPELVAYGSANVDDAMDTVGLPLLGLVPEDISVIDAANKYMPIILYGQTDAALAMLRMAKRLEGERIPLPGKSIKSRYHAHKISLKKTGGRI